ncbi:Golgi-associated plant pathogenesis-related protein 1-like protein [Leptotrombidium deliense]|uniref:Golgi-associated plant pathogenesis-related protein 1-like protein n=1 Tax=Leptotrombidium deliense TaxID=299467 RepID=A0A443SVA1_9ACAR|nr:Golgi-associated plant pathogenesis-related protein 1-like protein [Leptotrombidium deliense]
MELVKRLFVGLKQWLSVRRREKLIFYGGVALGGYLTVRFVKRLWRRWEPPDIVRDDDEEEEFVEDCLEWHNYYRRLHGVPYLTINKKLSENALSWAQHLANERKMYHQPNNEYGENIFMRSSSRSHFHISAKNAVFPWYHEIEDYVVGEEPANLAEVGHFTQLVWKETRQMGVARARSSDGHILMVVAEYLPSGNIIGQFVNNVPPPTS